MSFIKIKASPCLIILALILNFLSFAPSDYL